MIKYGSDRDKDSDEVGIRLWGGGVSGANFLCDSAPSNTHFNQPSVLPSRALVVCLYIAEIGFRVSLRPSMGQFEKLVLRWSG